PFVILPSRIGNTGVSVSHGQGAGYLGACHEPYFLHEGAAAESFAISERNAPGGVDPARLKTRQALLDAVDCAHRTFDATETSRSGDSATDRALNLIFAENAKKALDIASERDELRSRYGRNTFGQSCLLARRLVENGVRLGT